MKKLYVLPYKQLSASAKALAQAVGGRVIKLVDSKFTPKKGRVVVNWGCNKLPEHVQGATIINTVPAVQLATHKLLALRALRDAGVPIPEFTEDKDVATNWFVDGKEVVVLCRTVLRGSGGAGIVIAHSADELVTAPLYTRYVKKRDEYRVHVCGGSLLHVQQKKCKTDADVVDWKIRNHKNGFIYAIEGVNAPDVVVNAALAAVPALGLDFGAVDVIYNQHYNTAYVLEVNTAPGLEGTTLAKYAEGLKGHTDV